MANKKNLKGRVIVGVFFYHIETLETSPFHVLRVEKRLKGDSISFSFEANVKGQALGDPFKFKKSEKIK